MGIWDFPSMSRPRTVVLLPSTTLLSPDSLPLLDCLRVRDEATYIISAQDISLGNMIGDDLAILHANIFTAEAFLHETHHGRYDLIFIPGAPSDSELFTRIIMNIWTEFVDVIATGTGRLLLASAGLLKGRVASSRHLDLSAAQYDFARVWDAEIDMILDGNTWTAADDAETLRKVAVMYKAHRYYPASAVFPALVRKKHMMGELLGALGNPIAPPGVTSPSAMWSGETIAHELSTLSLSNALEVTELVFHFAVRLGLEGFTAPCNSLLQSVFRLFPNTFQTFGNPCLQSVEFLWEGLGERPDVPWEAPLQAQLVQWDNELRNEFPPDEDKPDILESIKIRMDDGDRFLAPYTLSGAVVMALDAGRHDQARLWMQRLTQDAMNSDTNDFWSFNIARWRPLVSLALTGVVAEATGHSAEQAAHDAEVVKQALHSLRPASTAAREGRNDPGQYFTDMRWDRLITMLDIVKWEQHKTLLRHPASLMAVEEAEERLGIVLPADYKQFLLVSNGIEFMPSIDAPGFRPVEELQWQTAEELGLDGFRVDLGCKVDPAEYALLPEMNRLLVISDDSEEMVWFVDPVTVEEAIQVLKTEGRTDDVVGEPGWRAVFWVHYLADLEWLPSFRRYIERLAREAEKAGEK